MPPGPSSKPAQFDALSLLREIQTDVTPSTVAPPENDAGSDQDEDFMSDKFLTTTEEKRPLIYSDKRRKLEAHHANKSKSERSIREQEEEAREEGLDRDLLAEAEIVAGGGTLPPLGKGGIRRWDLLESHENGERGADARVGEASGGEDGTTKAMRMMLAMGYRRGQALGKRVQGSDGQEEEPEVEEEEEDEVEEDGGEATQHSARPGETGPADDARTSPLDSDEEQEEQKERQVSQERQADEYLTGGTFSASSPLESKSMSKAAASAQLEPLRPDQRWLGLNRRAGIGMIPQTPASISSAIRAKAASSTTSTADQSAKENDFRTRISTAHRQRHVSNLLSRSRQTLIQLDQSSSIQYNPLWLNSEIYHLLSGHTYASSTSFATIDERMQTDPSFREAVELLQSALSSQQQQQQDEAKTFLELDTEQQLELVLGCLRREHRYCLFCGCQYSSAKELEEVCPGETEDDHD
ncbi:G-patch domain-containing protein [Pseudozyma hubeiensis]|nr:G-patch domain-containing protein [Pseudozyma hubeiensis]